MPTGQPIEVTRRLRQVQGEDCHSETRHSGSAEFLLQGWLGVSTGKEDEGLAKNVSVKYKRAHSVFPSHSTTSISHSVPTLVNHPHCSQDLL
jgi:hypothetical protein